MASNLEDDLLTKPSLGRRPFLVDRRGAFFQSKYLTSAPIFIRPRRSDKLSSFLDEEGRTPPEYTYSRAQRTNFARGKHKSEIGVMKNEKWNVHWSVKSPNVSFTLTEIPGGFGIFLAQVPNRLGSFYQCQWGVTLGCLCCGMSRDKLAGPGQGHQVQFQKMPCFWKSLPNKQTLFSQKIAGIPNSRKTPNTTFFRTNCFKNTSLSNMVRKYTTKLVTLVQDLCSPSKTGEPAFLTPWDISKKQSQGFGIFRHFYPKWCVKTTDLIFWI